MSEKERLDALEARLNELETVMTKILHLVKGQNEVVQKLADAVAAILKKMADNIKE